MPTPPSDLGSPQHLPLKSLFMTPRSSTRQRSAAITPETPSNVEMSDVDTLSVSSEQTSVSSVTPDMSKLTLGCGCGRPRKQLVKPTFDNFPIEGSEQEQKRYIKKKCTEMWRYNKLTGSDASNYWQSELEHVKGYQKKKKQGEGSASEDSGSEHKKKLSRQR